MKSEQKRMLSLLMEMWDITFFSEEEIYPDEFPPLPLLENIMPTLCLVNQVRKHTGTPIIITSSYRSELKNTIVGGAKNSLHLLNNALDWKFLYPYPECYHEMFTLINKGKFTLSCTQGRKRINITPTVLGVGLYTNFIHTDTRGFLGRKAPARWDFSTSAIRK